MLDYNKINSTVNSVIFKLNQKNIGATLVLDSDNITINEQAQTMTFLENVEKNKYKEFSNNHDKSHFLQSYEWGQFCFKIKKQIPYYVGMKNSRGELVATALLLEKKMPFGYSYMYSPRGFLIDYTNKEYIKLFTNYLKKYLKKNKVIYCKFDPDIKYQDIDSNANKIIGGENNYELYDYMLSLGYKHGGFYKLYDGNQPRYTFRINLTHSLDDIFNKFSTSFLKSLKRSEYYNLDVDNEIISKDFYRLIQYNSNKNGFNPHSEKYYQIFSCEMKENIKYFNIKIKPKDLLIKIENDLIEQENLLKNTTKRQEDIKSRIARLTKDKEIFSKINKEEVVVCSIICTYTKNHVWSFFQGSDELANSTFAISRCYYEAIKDAKENGYEFFDLFGTTGDPNTTYKNLAKLHAFKTGFGDEYIEFIGEFDLINNYLLYKLLPYLLKFYRKTRTILEMFRRKNNIITRCAS